MIQVKCLMPKLCDVNGVTLVATDYGQGDRTDFIMSPSAFSRLGVNKIASEEIKKKGTVDIEFKRVPCKYTGNVLFHVQQTSSNPGYLAVVILNVNGKYDVTAVEMWQVRKHILYPFYKKQSMYNLFLINRIKGVIFGRAHACNFQRNNF